jgi:signal transduction histidine kinase
MLYPDGRYRWTRARCVPVRDAQGNVMRYVTFQIDVDDLKQAEMLLEAEVQLLEMVARGEPLPQIFAALTRHVEALCHECWCAVLLVDPDHQRFRVGAGPQLPEAFNAHLDGQVIDARQDACSLAVSERRRIVTADVHQDSRWQGSSWTALLREHGYAACCALPILSGTGAVSGVIAVYRTKAVSPRSQDQDAVDRFTKIAGIAIDRTTVEEGLNRARAELAHVARIATLSTMTASITHEVSQPIAGILTNASIMVRMLAADPPNLAGITETVRRTLRDANRASDVITRLRAMFNKKAPTIEALDLNHAAREVIAVAAGELQKGHAVVDVALEENLPPVHGDRVQLQQVILNLILNAVDAMSGINDRPRNLWVRTEHGADDSVRLSVRDSGTGFAPGAIDKLFDAFYTTKAHGMGVGLAISRSIIKNHKGELWAQANEGPGATFLFSIPRAAAQAAGMAVGAES